MGRTTNDAISEAARLSKDITDMVVGPQEDTYSTAAQRLTSKQSTLWCQYIERIGMSDRSTLKYTP